MEVDESGCDYKTGGIDHSAGTGGVEFADCGNAAVQDGDIAVEPGVTGTVDNPAAANQHVEPGLLSFHGMHEADKKQSHGQACNSCFDVGTFGIWERHLDEPPGDVCNWLRDSAG